MNINRLFDSNIRESDKDAKALREHEATRPEIIKEEKHIDGPECIPAARAYLDAKEANSPTAPEKLAVLIAVRQKRDRLRQNFNARLAELRRKIESYTKKPIQVFIDDAVNKLRNLPTLYKFEQYDEILNKGRSRRAVVSTMARRLNKPRTYC